LEGPMDAARRAFSVIQMEGDWYWRLDRHEQLCILISANLLHNFLF
jgi:hypothetical protein